LEWDCGRFDMNLKAYGYALVLVIIIKISGTVLPKSKVVVSCKDSICIKKVVSL